MRKDIALLVEQVNSKFERNVGNPIIQPADEITNPFLLRRPSGIASLDITIGGGWPAGTLCQIASPDGVGKNAICNQTVATVQEIYGKDSCIAWICTEMTLDKSFAHLFGAVVPMSNKEIAMINAARLDKGIPKLSKSEVEFRKKKLGEFLVVDNGSSAQRLEVALDLIESNKFQIVVIDSLASLLTEMQEETNLEDEPQQSSEARLITRFCCKYWGKHGRAYNKETDLANWTTVLATYQVRGNRSPARYKKAWSVGGAYALRHAKAIDLHMENGERIPPDTKKAQTGKVVKFTVKKGKAGCHEGGIGSVSFLHKEGYDVMTDCAKLAKAKGILKRAGKYWNWENEEDGKVKRFEGGLKGVIKEMILDRSFYWKIYRQIMRSEGAVCLYKM